jgi:hypothetical protein
MGKKKIVARRGASGKGWKYVFITLIYIGKANGLIVGMVEIEKEWEVMHASQHT